MPPEKLKSGSRTTLRGKECVNMADYKGHAQRWLFGDGLQSAVSDEAVKSAQRRTPLAPAQV